MKVLVGKLILIISVGFFLWKNNFIKKIYIRSIYIKQIATSKMSVKPKYHSLYPNGTLPEENAIFYEKNFMALLHMIEDIYKTCPELSQYPQAEVINMYDMILSVYRANLERELENFYYPEYYQETSKIIFKVVWNSEQPSIQMTKNFHSNPIENFSIAHDDIESVQFLVPTEYLDAMHESISSINRSLNDYRFHFWEKGRNGFEQYLKHSTHRERLDWKEEDGHHPVHDIPGFASWNPQLPNLDTRTYGAYEFDADASLAKRFEKLRLGEKMRI